jgi:signal transduction histidine kinase
LELRCREGAILLSVSDNGKGFATDVARPDSGGEGGYGLFGVRERLKLWGGGLTIDSGASGTRATLLLPLAPSNLGLSGVLHRAVRKKKQNLEHARE